MGLACNSLEKTLTQKEELGNEFGICYPYIEPHAEEAT
jgi:hypothetical protein